MSNLPRPSTKPPQIVPLLQSTISIPACLKTDPIKLPSNSRDENEPPSECPPGDFIVTNSRNSSAHPITLPQKPVIPIPSKVNSNLSNGVSSMTLGNEVANNNLDPRILTSQKQQQKVPELKLNGVVGFETLPYQLVAKCQKAGFQFNIMCVGETGMGKTTLIQSLFNMRVDFEPCNHELKTVELRIRNTELCEGMVRVKLRVIETAGFGDQLDKDRSAKVIVDYINAQFESYLKEELKVKRSLHNYDDTRIHACLYFISPTGHGLKALDLVTLRELSKRVNVIPVIAKADTACKDELTRFKEKIMSEMKANKIEIYQFPTNDETVRKENAGLNTLVPFAVIGSTDFITKEDGRQVRARKYPWGIVEVENEEHCDFVKLREAILRINEDSLRERTHSVLYERYRSDRLRQMKMTDGDAGPKMMEAYSQRQKQLDADFKKRQELEDKAYQDRILKKDAEHKHREELLNMRHREITERSNSELKKLDDEISALMTEKMRLENSKHKKFKVK